jgi:hypothetical protein
MMVAGEQCHSSCVSGHQDDQEKGNNDDAEPREGAAVGPVNRRPRGRPPGSKNKPKPLVFLSI